MRLHIQFALATSLAGCLFSSAAHAQFQIDWYTIDCGGGTSTGASFTLTGTIGQPDTGVSVGGSLECTGGFWGAFSGTAPSCYANCDNSSVTPVLTANDFQCFLNAFAANASYANCDQSTVAPVLTANDFQCFLNMFATGCP